MKTLLYSILHQVRKALLAMAIALPMVSCHTVWDDDDDCPRRNRVSGKVCARL